MDLVSENTAHNTKTFLILMEPASFCKKTVFLGKNST